MVMTKALQMRKLTTVFAPRISVFCCTRDTHTEVDHLRCGVLRHGTIEQCACDYSGPSLYVTMDGALFELGFLSAPLLFNGEVLDYTLEKKCS